MIAQLEKEVKDRLENRGIFCWFHNSSPWNLSNFPRSGLSQQRQRGLTGWHCPNC